MTKDEIIKLEKEIVELPKMSDDCFSDELPEPEKINTTPFNSREEAREELLEKINEALQGWQTLGWVDSFLDRIYKSKGYVCENKA